MKRSSSAIFGLLLALLVGYVAVSVGYARPPRLLTLYAILLLAVLCLQLPKSDRLLWIMAGLGVLLSAYGIAQYRGWGLAGHQGFRITGPFDNPAGFAGALSLLFPAGVYLTLREKSGTYQRWASGLGSLLAVSALMLCNSRAGVLLPAGRYKRA